jgi:uncharacterized protein
VTEGDPAARKRRRFRSLRRLRLKLILQWMGRAESPERVAAAVAIGVGVGLSPFIGFHAILAIGLALIFRLNKLDTLVGSFIGNPWTLPPVFALGYRIGHKLMGSPTRGRKLPWHRILHSDFWVAFRGPDFGVRLTAFILGTSILAILAAGAAYAIVLGLLRLYHRRHPKVAARAARRRALEVFARSEHARREHEHRVH